MVFFKLIIILNRKYVNDSRNNRRQKLQKILSNIASNIVNKTRWRYRSCSSLYAVIESKPIIATWYTSNEYGRLSTNWILCEKYYIVLNINQNARGKRIYWGIIKRSFHAVYLLSCDLKLFSAIFLPSHLQLGIWMLTSAQWFNECKSIHSNNSRYYLHSNHVYYIYIAKHTHKTNDASCTAKIRTIFSDFICLLIVFIV